MKLRTRFRALRPAGMLLLCLGIILISVTSLYAQDVNITGKITGTGGTPLPGVSIQVAGTTKGASTGADGQFKLSAPTGSTLKISFIGYLSKEIKVTNANPLHITLEEDVQKLNDVVVVGYGTQKKATLTGAITTVSMAEQEGRPITATHCRVFRVYLPT
ncbi:hypothetical protein HHL17_19725 [Chitinophaga sp. G-6-1-13]|uniref:Uncharacterized protein n=1 Tax=Chitinophaga fulva TaxID=2728842 RepID=A0A848GS34_9BACT|nr:carboxypeptidase-like regulatory domain-containing protein [Chitinophaga fulva]NML39440.1 hypothetical protein [Chitinophaga fulva]